jgi:hypothetical protein
MASGVVGADCFERLSGNAVAADSLLGSRRSDVVSGGRLNRSGQVMVARRW